MATITYSRFLLRMNVLRTVFNNYTVVRRNCEDIITHTNKLLLAMMVKAYKDRDYRDKVVSWVDNTAPNCTVLFRDIAAEVGFAFWGEPRNSPESLLTVNAINLLDTVNLYKREGIVTKRQIELY